MLYYPVFRLADVVGYSSLPHSEMLYCNVTINPPSGRYSSLPHSEMLYSSIPSERSRGSYSSLPHSEMLYYLKGSTVPAECYSSLPHSEMLYSETIRIRCRLSYSSLPHSEMLYYVKRKVLRPDGPQHFAHLFLRSKQQCLFGIQDFFFFCLFSKKNFH